MRKDNGINIPVNALTDVYAATYAQVIMEKKVPLEARELLPKITNIDGMDISSRTVTAVKYFTEGKALITDLRANTLPVMNARAMKETWDLKWIGIAVRTDVNERDDIANGKVIPVNKITEAARVIAETENEFLLNGFNKLGAEGINEITSTSGIHIVAATKPWATATGEEIVGDIANMYKAMTTGKLYKAKTLSIPEELNFLINSRVYTDISGKTIDSALTIKEVLDKRGYYTNYKPVIGIKAPLMLDDEPENFGFVAVQDISVGETYMNGRTEETPIEEKISEFMLLQPMSIAKLEGATV